MVNLKFQKCHSTGGISTTMLTSSLWRSIPFFMNQYIFTRNFVNHLYCDITCDNLMPGAWKYFFKINFDQSWNPGASFSSFQKSFLAGTNAVLKTLSEQGVTRPLFFNFFTTKWNIFRRSMLLFYAPVFSQDVFWSFNIFFVEIKVQEKWYSSNFHQRLELNSTFNHKMHCIPRHLVLIWLSCS
jgi:hypothetical protein